jgi:periplasmic divalent cation tolerance protein
VSDVSDNSCLVVLCTCPEGLAACVNRLPGVVSNYRWDGQAHEDTETLLLIKSTQGRLAALTARIRSLHPAELPEVVAVPVMGGLEEYLDWVRASVSGPTTS